MIDGTIIVAVITVGGSILVAALTSYLTKAKEREAEWRSQKLAHYKEFMAALNNIVGPPPPVEDKIRFANAANNIYLVGSAPVLTALRAYLDETADSNRDRKVDRHDELLTKLMFAIRDDIGMTPDKPDEGFEFRLWSGRPR